MSTEPLKPFFPQIHDAAFLGADSFFEAAAKLLAQKLKVRHVLIAELFSRRARAVCSLSSGILQQTADFDILGTPLEGLIESGYFACPSGVLNKFSEDKYLRALKAEGFIAKLILAPKGTPAGFIALAHDSELKETAEIKTALEIAALCVGSEFDRRKSEIQSEKNYQQILDAIADMVLVKGPKSRILWANKAFRDYYGMTNEQLKDLIDAPFVEPDFTQQYVKDDALVFETGKVLNIQEEPVTRHDGKIFFYNTVKSPIFDARGKVVMTVGVSRDVTEPKKVMAQLVQSQKLETMGILAGGIAHDLNNQMMPILGYLELALLEMDSAMPFYKYIDEAKTAVQHSSGIIRRLVEYSRPSSSGKKIMAVAPFLQGLKPIFKQFLSASVEVDIKLEDSLRPIFANQSELESVMINLAANAKDAMPLGGILNIRAENFISQPKVRVKGLEDIPYVRLTVQDSGSGMAPEVMTHIFDPFFTTKKTGEGTGLGLAMVYKIVKDHQGIIDVQSRPGEGTVFHLYFPARSEQEAAPVSKIDRVPISKAAEPLKTERTILFVDDEKGIREVGGKFLMGMGYKVVLAGDGEEALRIYESQKDIISIVILDMTMPKLSGRELIQKLFKLNPRIKIIVCSGYTSEALPQELLSAGVCEFIEKPYTISAISRALQKISDLQ